MAEEPSPAQSVIRGVLGDATAALEAAGIPYVVIGGLASATWGKPGPINDIDLFVRESDVGDVLKTLEAGGFSTRQEYPTWLYKAFKNDVLVDVIFRVQEKIVLDDEMLGRAVHKTIEGQRVPLVSPEDLIVTLAAAHEDDTEYWYNALAVIKKTDLDWDYVVARADGSPLRMLSLLVYAQSEDIAVPDSAIARIYEQTIASRTS